MFGKIFASMFTGSMHGKGPGVISVWAYVIANTNHHHLVELFPDHLAPILGMKVEDVTSVIEFLCAPDPKSRTPHMEGRRLLHQNGFTYLTVNHETYRAIQNEEDRRIYFRNKQREHRASKPAPRKPKQNAQVFEQKPVASVKNVKAFVKHRQTKVKPCQTMSTGVKINGSENDPKTSQPELLIQGADTENGEAATSSSAPTCDNNNTQTTHAQQVKAGDDVKAFVKLGQTMSNDVNIGQQQSNHTDSDSDTDKEKKTSLDLAAEPLKPSSPTRIFTDLWKEAFQKRFGIPYIFKGGADGKAVQVLLKTGKSPEELVGIASTAWEKTGKQFWNCQNQTSNIAKFAGAFNAINVELNQASSMAAW